MWPYCDSMLIVLSRWGGGEGGGEKKKKKKGQLLKAFRHFEVIIIIIIIRRRRILQSAYPVAQSVDQYRLNTYLYIEIMNVVKKKQMFIY